jgi:hypothetical protein
MNSTDFPVHPAANAIPEMGEEEFANLKQDIAEKGQCEDIVVWEGQLLDGRHRLRACQELGIEPKYFELCENVDPWTYAISRNLHRRHLTTGQRSMIAAKLATLKNGSNQHKKEGGPKGLPTSRAAKLMAVSPTSVKRARKVIANAPDEVRKAVERGDLPLSAANRKLDKAGNANGRASGILETSHDHGERLTLATVLKPITDEVIAEFLNRTIGDVAAALLRDIDVEGFVKARDMLRYVQITPSDLDEFIDVILKFGSQIDPAVGDKLRAAAGRPQTEPKSDA